MVIKFSSAIFAEQGANLIRQRHPDYLINLTQNILQYKGYFDYLVSLEYLIKTSIEENDLMAFQLIFNKAFFSNNMDLKKSLDCSLYWAGTKNRVNFLEYILTHLQYSTLVNIEELDFSDKNNNLLALSCFAGSFDCIEFLLTNKKIKKNANINYSESLPLRNAVKRGQKQIVEFLLYSPVLANHANPYSCSHQALCTAINNNQKDIAILLINIYQKNMLMAFYKNYKNKFQDNPTMKKLEPLIQERIITGNQVVQIKNLPNKKSSTL